MSSLPEPSLATRAMFAMAAFLGAGMGAGGGGQGWNESLVVR